MKMLMLMSFPNSARCRACSTRQLCTGCGADAPHPQLQPQLHHHLVPTSDALHNVRVPPLSPLSTPVQPTWSVAHEDADVLP